MKNELDAFEKSVIFIMFLIVAWSFFSSPGIFLSTIILGITVYFVDTTFGDGVLFLVTLATLGLAYLIDRFVTNIEIFDKIIDFIF